MRPSIPKKAMQLESELNKRQNYVVEGNYNAPDHKYINQALKQQHLHFHQINTAVDMDETGKRLTFRTAISGQEREQWLQAHAE